MKALALCVMVGSAVGYFTLHCIDHRALAGAVFLISSCLVQALYETT